MGNFRNYIMLIMAVLLASCAVTTGTTGTDAVQPEKVNGLTVIGEIESVYMLPMKSPFYARIDTGAEISSLDAKTYKTFERDGEKWVSFDLINRETGEKKKFEKKIIRHISIKRIGGDEKRVIVNMDMKFGNEIINEDFSLANREKFEYQVLIGRNVLMGRAVVDTSKSYTFNQEQQ